MHRAISVTGHGFGVYADGVFKQYRDDDLVMTHRCKSKIPHLLIHLILDNYFSPSADCSVVKGMVMTRSASKFPSMVVVAGIMMTAYSLASAQTPISPRSFTESLRASVPHGGTRALGVLAESQSETSYRSIYVATRAAFRGNVCVSVNSIDGLYLASANYTIDSQPGLIIMSFPSQKLGSNVGYRITELVIGTRVGACGAAQQSFMIGTWQPPERITRIGFAVNAGAGATAFTSEPRRGRVDCDQASRLYPSSDIATITHVCWVSAAKLATSPSLTVFRETPAGRNEIIFPLLQGGKLPPTMR